MHQKLRTHWRGPPADACQRVFSCEGKGDPFLYERRRGELSYAMAYGYGPEFVAEEARGEHLGDPACERAGRGPRPLGRERRRGRQVPRARSAWRRCCGRVPGGLGRSGLVGIHSSDTLSHARGGTAVLPFLLPAGGRGCLSRREELWAMAVPLVPGPGLGNANTARKPTGALPES